MAFCNMEVPQQNEKKHCAMVLVLAESLTLSGVRQGCVLSPRLFCAALELAMSEWRAANPQGGIDLGGDMLRLLDLRFADDVFIFANTKEGEQNLLDSLVRHLAAAGLMLNT